MRPGSVEHAFGNTMETEIDCSWRETYPCIHCMRLMSLTELLAFQKYILRISDAAVHLRSPLGGMAISWMDSAVLIVW